MIPQPLGVTPFMWLLHGTTLARAESIVQHGPDIDFVEPGAAGIAENFSFTAEGTPSAVGDSLTYARGKAIACPNELGPAVVAVDVPEEVVRMAAVEHLSLFVGLIEYDEGADLGELVALCGGVIQFDPGPALDSLLARWEALAREIRGVP
jgi:hypothetical protein